MLSNNVFNLMCCYVDLSVGGHIAADSALLFHTRVIGSTTFLHSRNVLSSATHDTDCVVHFSGGTESHGCTLMLVFPSFALHLEEICPDKSPQRLISLC